MKRRRFLFSLISIGMFPFIARTEQQHDRLLRIGETFNNPLPKTEQNSQRWQVAVDCSGRFNKFRGGQIPWPRGSVVKWNRDELKKRYYFTIYANAHFWDGRKLSVEDVKWALKRAQIEDNIKNIWRKIPPIEELTSDSFIIPYGNNDREDINAFPMMLAALFEQN